MTEYKMTIDGETEVTGTFKQVWEHTVTCYGHLTVDHLNSRGFSIEPNQVS